MHAERRSPVLSEFDPGGFEIGIRSGMRCALATKQDSIHTNFLADISALRRRLFVGVAASDLLARNGIDITLGLLDVAVLDHGARLARIHRDQYLLIDGPDGNAVEALFELDPGRHDDVLVLPYDAAEFVCGGPDAGSIIAELCPADLGSASASLWNATRLAHCEAIVHELEEPPHYRIGCSYADAGFLFGVLREIIVSADGVLMGLNDYQSWLKSEEQQHDTE